MTSKRDQKDRKRERRKAPPELRQQSKRRGDAVDQAAKEHRRRHGQGAAYARMTKAGEVQIRRVRTFVDEDGMTVVEVHVNGPVDGGDPHFRVINPPGLVEDPAGDVALGNRRYRADPLAALAEVIGQHGGTMVKEGRRR